MGLPTFQITEFLLLLVVLAGWLYLLRNVVATKARPWLLAAQTALVVGLLSTNIEAFYAPEIFNIIEHAVGIALAGVLYLMTIYTYMSSLSPSSKGRKRK